MLKKRTIALLLCFCVFCCLSILIAAQPVYAQDGYQKNPVDYREIDDYLRSAVDNAHIPGMSVTIVNKDAVLFSGNYGDCEAAKHPFIWVRSVNPLPPSASCSWLSRGKLT